MQCKRGISGGEWNESVDQGVAEVDRVTDQRGVLPDAHHEGGVPAEAEQAIFRGGVFVGLIRGGADPKRI